MIRGSVQDLQALVPLVFRRPGQPDIEIEFVVDTGFAGALTLPSAAVASLGLPYLQEMTANLADDNSIQTDVHVATILWNGQESQVAVLALGRRPLLGTALLAGSELVARFQEDGLVQIEPL